MAQMTLSQLAELLGGELAGDGGRIVRGVASLESAGADEVSFLTNVRYERHVAETKAAAVIVAADYAGDAPAVLRCRDPYYAFREAMVAFHGFRRPHFDGVDARAVVDPSAELGEGACVAALAFIGPNVKVGPRTVIYPGVYVGPGCVIGGACTLYPNVTIYDGCVLGDRVTVHSGTSIGQDGFGYATHGGRHEKIPQTGRVVLEDDVEIGSCCAIERATLGETVIGAGTKFADLVAIGHGTSMGKHCLVVSQVGIAGSTTVGDYCVFGGQAGVVGHIRIGDRVQVAAQSGVINDVPSDQQVLGSPAIARAEARRSLIGMARLPEMRIAIRKLAKDLAAVRRKLGLRAGPDADKPGAADESGPGREG